MKKDIELTELEKKLLKHSLGLGRQKEPFRNYYITGPKCIDYEVVEGLVKRGLMIKTSNVFNEVEKEYIYRVTNEGKKLILDIKRYVYEFKTFEELLCENCIFQGCSLWEEKFFCKITGNALLEKNKRPEHCPLKEIKE